MTETGRFEDLAREGGEGRGEMGWRGREVGKLKE
jgi:hypothetical protein